MKFQTKYFTNISQNRKRRFLICIFLFVIYSVIYLSIFRFDNTVPFFGDTIEYQSIGVNFAKGHGIQKAGGIEKYSEYKFSETPVKHGKEFFINTDISDFQKFIRKDFYREPAYPFFIGVIYKISGVNPKTVKYVQLFLLLLIASFLPLLGYRFWNNSGFCSGLISSPFYIYFNSFMANLMLTEVLVSFTIFLILCTYIYYLNRKNKFSSLLLGFSFGIGLLVKGSLTLIPLLYLIIILYKYLNKPEKNYFSHFILVIISFIITILPWVIYSNYSDKREIETKNLNDIIAASINNNISQSIKESKIDSIKKNIHRFFLISNQSQKLLLNGHNEYVPEMTETGQYNFPEGGWLPKWKFKKESFYNNDNLYGVSVLLRVINFYKHFPQKIFKLIIHKIILSYSHFKFLWLIILLYILETYCNIANYFTIKYPDKMQKRLLFFILLSGIIGIFFINPYNNNSLILIYFITTVLIFPTLIFNLFIKGKPLLLRIPDMISIIFVNFFLITIMIFGFQRLIQVIDFIITIVSVQYLMLFLKNKILTINNE